MKWKKLHKIAIAGSRKFAEPDLARQYIHQYITKHFDSTEDVVIITGGAIGIDSAMERLCFTNGIKNLIIHARWLELEKSAGPRRNGHIVDLANEVFCFWDGSSKGTADVIRRAKKAGKLKRVLSVRKLRKILKVKPPVKISIPSKTSKRDSKRIRDLIKNADLEEIFR